MKCSPAIAKIARNFFLSTAVLVATSISQPAFAWGDEGHEIVAAIAYPLLTANAKDAVDALLEADGDTLTADNFASRATWADKWRDANNRKLHYAETHQWHFVDMEISQPDLNAACFQWKATPPNALASDVPAPANACVVTKIMEFRAELADTSLPRAERIKSLKFLLHFVGDLHQPLHASDDHDQGGNCEQIQTGPTAKKVALHHYWDTDTVEAVIEAVSEGGDQTIDGAADALRQEITPQQKSEWSTLDPKAWAQETFTVAKTVAYKLPKHAACGGTITSKNYPAFTLPNAYQADAEAAVRIQLKKAGVRLAALLNDTLK